MLDHNVVTLNVRTFRPPTRMQVTEVETVSVPVSVSVPD
jgi:hypothetical protein